MRWGFGWELGPFELFDAIGSDAVVDAWRQQAAGKTTCRRLFARGARQRPQPLPRRAGAARGAAASQILRTREGTVGLVVRRNAGASLVDLGDGVLCVEFHSKMNAIGGDTLEMLQAGVAEAERNFAALVVGNDAPNFSAGANLMLLLLEAQEGNWDEIDLMVRSFQRATMALRYAHVPVVAAPAGLALGGGCEVVLHADRTQAAAESYIGLVEAGVGLIPAGAGTKEMLARAVETPAGARGPAAGGAARLRDNRLRKGVHEWARRGADRLPARRGWHLDEPRAPARRREGAGDGSSRQRVPGAAAPNRHSRWRRVAARRARARRSPRVARRAHQRPRRLIGRKLAWILAGGSLPHETTVSEQYLLDLEREAFLALCGERKTLERIQHTLKTGKTLRN